jgi:hypothetical protein
MYEDNRLMSHEGPAPNAVPIAKFLEVVRRGPFIQPKDPGPIATILDDKEDWDAMKELLDPLGVRWANGDRLTDYPERYGDPVRLHFNSRSRGALTVCSACRANDNNVPTVSHSRFVQHVKKYLDYAAQKP